MFYLHFQLEMAHGHSACTSHHEGWHGISHGWFSSASKPPAAAGAGAAPCRSHGSRGSPAPSSCALGPAPSLCRGSLAGLSPGTAAPGTPVNNRGPRRGAAPSFCYFSPRPFKPEEHQRQSGCSRLRLVREASGWTGGQALACRELSHPDCLNTCLVTECKKTRTNVLQAGPPTIVVLHNINI